MWVRVVTLLVIVVAVIVQWVWPSGMSALEVEAMTLYRQGRALQAEPCLMYRGEYFREPQKPLPMQ